ncbi:MAG: hypothetical protein L6Q68_03280 [Aquabacterium sp.]|nr:hypothetical protein [Aquabacterium sp.]
MRKLGSDWHRVGLGLSVRFSVDGDAMGAEWRPRMPTPRECRRTLDAYRRARNLFVAELARNLNRTILVVELEKPKREAEQ